MEITVTFRHIDASESLKAYAEEKVSKMDKYFDFPVEAHIVLAVEKFRRLADVTLNVNGTMIKGVVESEDMYSSIDQVIDKIEKQVKRFRDKMRDRRAEGRKNETATIRSEREESPDASPEELQIKEEKIVAKPMDPEEAAMQFNLSQQDFLVFRNSRSREINVMYKRKDGNLCLIIPSS
jgi:putative sigma-54 modulation protein